MSPTQRSLAELRKDGWSACIVEKYVAPIRQRIDAFHFGDILAVKVGIPGATLIQTTTASHAANRLDKIRSIAEAGIWLAAGNRIVIHGWAKRGPRGKHKVWTCSITEVK
jgi:hypothetical protein